MLASQKTITTIIVIIIIIIIRSCFGSSFNSLMQCLFPGVRFSRDWQQAWETHGAISLDPVASRGSSGYWIERELREMVEEEDRWLQLGITVENYDWDQYTANPARSSLQRGTSACAFIQGYFVLQFLSDGVVQLTREIVADLVEEYDSAKGPADGSFARTEILMCAERFCVPLVATEPPVDSSTGFPQPIHSSKHLSDVLQAFSSEHVERFACALTCFKSGGSGNTFGIFVQNNVKILDSHNRRDLHGERQGACLATFEHCDYTIVSDWIVKVLLPRMECSGPMDIAAFSVSPNPKQLATSAGAEDVVSQEQEVVNGAVAAKAVQLPKEAGEHPHPPRDERERPPQEEEPAMKRTKRSTKRTDDVDVFAARQSKLYALRGLEKQKWIWCLIMIF